MSKQLKNILLGLIASIVVAVVLLRTMDYFSFTRNLVSITAGIQKGMALHEAETILMSRNFTKTVGQASDGDKFAFRRSVSDIHYKTNFFFGTVKEKVAVMVRVETQDGIVKCLVAEKFRFEEAG